MKAQRTEKSCIGDPNYRQLYSTYVYFGAFGKVKRVLWSISMSLPVVRLAVGTIAYLVAGINCILCVT